MSTFKVYAMFGPMGTVFIGGWWGWEVERVAMWWIHLYEEALFNFALFGDEDGFFAGFFLLVVFMKWMAELHQSHGLRESVCVSVRHGGLDGWEWIGYKVVGYAMLVAYSRRDRFLVGFPANYWRVSKSKWKVWLAEWIKNRKVYRFWKIYLLVCFSRLLLFVLLNALFG